MNIGIVGFGVVGSAMSRLLGERNELSIYDKFIPALNSSDRRRAINACDLVFLCVPTPQKAGALECDLSAVEECVRWIEAPVCIRSTMPPGVTARLTNESGRPLVFSPEYLGEAPSHKWRDASDCGFLIVGGDIRTCDLVIQAYRAAFGERELAVYRTDSTTAELCKYMENCFLAMKVGFVNQFHDIAGSFGVDFDELRTLWLADSRIGASHTEVTAERGFGGRCLPKDLAAMISAMRDRGGAPLLEALMKYNQSIRRSEAGVVAGVAGGGAP